MPRPRTERRTSARFQTQEPGGADSCSVSTSGLLTGSRNRKSKARTARPIASPSAAHNTSSSLVSSSLATWPATGRSTPAFRSTRALDSHALLPPANSGAGPDLREFGRNGTYLVFRQLEQHVQEFSDFVASASGASTSPQDAEEFAARLVGRHRDGTPLVSTDSNPAQTNEFTFCGRSARLRLPGRIAHPSGQPA